MKRIESTLAAWSDHSRGAVILLAVLLAAAALTLSFRLGDALVSHQPEVRCEAAARHMLETGEWIVPYMEGKPRLEKPPLYYWEAAVAGLLLGRFDRTALRLPAVAAGLGLLIVVFVWGRSLGGARTGLLAALCLLVMADFVQFSRRGVAESSLALWTTLSLFLCDRLWWRQAPPPGRLLRPLLALSFTLAFLAKATVAVLVIGLPVVLLIVIERRFSFLARVRTWAWISVTLAACLAWYVAIVFLVPHGWETLRSELLLPITKTAEQQSATHYQNIFYFLPIILGGTAPACLFAPFALAAARRTRFWREMPRQRFVAMALIGLFLAFSLIPQKQRHYLLPLLPLAAILLADSIIRIVSQGPARTRRPLFWIGALSALAGVGLAVTGGLYLGAVLEDDAWTSGPWVIGLLVTAGAIFHAARRERPHLFAAAFAAQTILALLLVHGSLSVWQSRFRSGRVDVMTPEQATRWQHMFAEKPVVRRLMQAREWPSKPARRSAPRRKRSKEER